MKISEYFKISRTLESNHVLFSRMWTMGEPIFTTDIPTAAVTFDKKTGEQLSYLFNPDYFDKLDDYQKSFVISHECLHIILSHGKRSFEFDNAMLCNVAMDLVVNHMLVEKFGFDRNAVYDQQNLCWVDTVFGPDSEVRTDGTFEYYYNLLKSDSTAQSRAGKTQLVDSHNWEASYGAESGENKNDGVDNLNKQIVEAMEGEVQKMPDIGKHIQADNQEDLESKLAGNVAGNGYLQLKPKPIIKYKWETIIKKWSRVIQRKEKEKEQWARKNRRISDLPTKMMLPSYMEYEHENKGMIDVWFFQDTSGSCQSLAPRFFAAARSLNPKRFNVKMFCFDTKIYPTTLESGKLYGFGGTSFCIIEQYIQSEIRSKDIPYPAAVFVITDGYGDAVIPEQPKKWYWFLSTDYKMLIPNTCNIYKLSDFE